MKAIILAAGIGMRMRPLTDDKPKALLDISGQTIIERMLDLLQSEGIVDICIVTGYLHDKITQFIASKYPTLAVTYILNSDYHKTNNIYSLHLAFEKYTIDDDILIIESDLIFTREVLIAVLNSPHPNVAVVDRFKIGMDGTVVAVDGNLIVNIIPPHLQGPDFDFSDKFKTLNIYKFEKEFILNNFRKLLSFYATSFNDNCYYELILGLLVYMRQEQIFACDVSGELWCEVDDPNDLRLAEITFGKEASLQSLDVAFGGFWNFDFMDFAYIRNMYFPNNSVLADIRYNLTDLIHNYGSTQAQLNQKLAYFLLVSASRLCVLNGLSQVYPMLEDMLKDKKVLIPSPTFGEYSRIFPCHMTYRDHGLQLLEDTPENNINDADVIIFVNPNNPTGSCIPSESIMTLARQYSDKLFIIDESFTDFSEQQSVQTLLEDENLANILVLKSLSKCLGVPGLRIGYVYSRDEKWINEFNNRLPIWNCNSIAEYYLEIILKHRKTLLQSFTDTINDRIKFASMLSKVNVIEKVFESGSNFLLVKLNLSKEQLDYMRYTLLKNYNIYIKDVSSKFNNDGAYIRLAVRLPGENSALTNAIDSICSPELLHRP
ncbi:MAG: aminotransferase class I/II-fold pyridoxal phosphate-dependent enzyme [Limnohabitans sp.]